MNRMKELNYIELNLVYFRVLLTRIPNNLGQNAG